MLSLQNYTLDYVGDRVGASVHVGQVHREVQQGEVVDLFSYLGRDWVDVIPFAGHVHVGVDHAVEDVEFVPDVGDLHASRMDEFLMERIHDFIALDADLDFEPLDPGVGVCWILDRFHPAHVPVEFADFLLDLPASIPEGHKNVSLTVTSKNLMPWSSVLTVNRVTDGVIFCVVTSNTFHGWGRSAGLSLPSRRWCWTAMSTMFRTLSLCVT